VKSGGTVRRKRNLTLKYYHAVGGIAGALSQHANEVMASLPGLEIVVEQVFRALSEVDKEGRATRRALPFNRLLAETGVARRDLVRVLDRFRADDCSFVVPSLSAVPQLRDDTRIDVGHEALLRRWDRISADPEHNLGGGANVGWLASEEADGRLYRALLALLEAGPAVTLPLDQVESRSEWWKSRPRTAGWAERYGGGLDKVDALFKNSLAALETERAREAETERREREAERRKIEADEAAKRERLEHQAEVDRVRAESAHRLVRRTKQAALAMGLIAAIAVLFGILSSVFYLQTKGLLVAADRARAAAETATRAESVARLQADQAATSRASMAKEADKQRGKAQAQETIAVARAREAEQSRAAALAAASEAERQRTAAVNAAGAARVAEADALNQRTQAIRERSALFARAGRDAFFNGDNDAAAVFFAAAYTDSPRDRALKLALREALDNVAIRGGSLHEPGAPRAHGGLITTLKFNPNPRLRQVASASDDGTAKLWDPSGKLLHAFTDQPTVITSIAFDSTGRYLATAGADGSVKIRDLRDVTPRSARAPLELDGHTRRINAVLFSHDGTRLATASSDGNVKIWDGSTGKLVTQVSVGRYQVTDAAFTPDDRSLVTCSSDGTVRVWSPGTGQAVWTSSDAAGARAASSSLFRLGIAPDGKLVAAGSIDGTVVVYDLAAKKQLWLRNDNRGAINAITFDPAGRFVLAGSDDGTARLFDARSGEPQAVLMRSAASDEGRPAVLAALFRPLNGGIATTYADGSVAFWTLGGEAIADLRGRGGNAGGADFSPDGALFISGGRDGELFLWHPPSTLVPAAASHGKAIDSIVVRPSGSVLTASRDGTAALWKLEGTALTRERVFRHSFTDWVVSASFSPDGKKIITAGGASLKIWKTDAPAAAAPLSSLVTGNCATPPCTPQRFSAAGFIKDASRIMLSQTSADTKNFDYPAGRWWVMSTDAKRTFAQEPPSQPEISKLSATANGRYVLALSGQGVATFSELLDRQGKGPSPSPAPKTSASPAPTAKTLSFPPATDAAQSVRVSDAVLGNVHVIYALGSADGTIDIRSATGSDFRLSGQRGRISALAFSSDDRWLASAGSGDLLGMIWDVQGRTRHAVLKGHKGEITSIAFSPRSAAFVLTTSRDGTAKLWYRDTGDFVASVSVPDSLVQSAVFSPDGTAVLVGAANGKFYVWSIRGDVPAPAQMAQDVIDRLKRGEIQSDSGNLLLVQATGALEKVVSEAHGRVSAK